MGIRGPFGSNYPLDKFKGKDLLILGGGCGLAPLRSLFLTLVHEIKNYNSITFLAGAKSPKDCIFKDSVEEWRQYPNVKFLRTVDEVPTDEKWTETVGVATVLLNEVSIDPKDIHVASDFGQRLLDAVLAEAESVNSL